MYFVYNSYRFPLFIIPFNLFQTNETIRFTTYTDKPVNPCNDKTGEYYTIEQRNRIGCDNTTDYSMIDVGVFYNDVWAYKLCGVHGTFLSY
jgi:hypothetical protein